jgi:hypothetical protein
MKLRMMPITIMMAASETQVRRIRLPPPPRRRDGIANPSHVWNPVSWFYLSVAAGSPSIKRRCELAVFTDRQLHLVTKALAMAAVAIERRLGRLDITSP